MRRVAIGVTSEVYEGRHLASGEAVAVKSLHPECCVDPEVAARFINEAKTLQRLQHPHLVRALAWGIAPEGPPYMVLEWLPVDLHQILMRAGGRISPGASSRVAGQLADALAALHERGIIHRDLKPTNVLVLGRGEEEGLTVKLADLGLAKQLADRAGPESAVPVSTASNALLGTWDYMAPEQWIRSKTAGPEADVYSLGVLLFQMLAGRLPFIAGEQKHLMYLHLMEPPPLEALEGLSPPGLVALVGRMLCKTAAARPSMREVLEDLRATSDGSATFRRLF